MRSFAPSRRHTIVGTRDSFSGPTHHRAGEEALKALALAAKGAALIGLVTVVGHALWLAFAYLAELVRG